MAKLSRKQRIKRLEESLPEVVVYNYKKGVFATSRGSLFAGWAREQSHTRLKRVLNRPRAVGGLAGLAAIRMGAPPPVGEVYFSYNIFVSKHTAMALAATRELERRGIS